MSHSPSSSWSDDAQPMTANFVLGYIRVSSTDQIQHQSIEFQFVATCIKQLIFNATCAMGSSITVEKVCRELGIDWYRPTKLTRGLTVSMCPIIFGDNRRGYQVNAMNFKFFSNNLNKLYHDCQKVTTEKPDSSS